MLSARLSDSESPYFHRFPRLDEALTDFLLLRELPGALDMASRGRAWLWCQAEIAAHYAAHVERAAQQQQALLQALARQR